MSKKIKSTCPGCNNSFLHYPYHKREFCNRSCRSKSTVKTKKSSTCQHCSAVFTHQASLNPKCCSRDCSGKSQRKTKKNSTCQHCSAVFTHQPSLNPKCCSRSCSVKLRSKHGGCKAKCQQCNKLFPMTAQSGNKYCSRDCYHVARWGDKRPWADCSQCLAAVGFGTTITGKLLGVDPTSILGQRKKDGIEAQIPSMGSWRIWAKRKAAGKNPDRKRTASEITYERYHMDDIKQACEHGFTWVTIWEREASRRYAKARYDAMTPEEKALNQEIQTRRIKAKMEANPELKAKKAADHKQWREANKDKVKQTQREWVKNNTEKMRAYRKKQMENPAFRALYNQRKRFRNIMKSVKNGGTGSYSDKIGCTTEEFHRYMEAKFQPGMTWDNYGTYWHADHIIPCAAFDQSDPHQVALCWHHSNMQPLEARENLLKSDKFDEEQLNLLINQTN